MEAVMQPEALYFKPEEYTKLIKVSAKCYIQKAVTDLEKILSERELERVRGNGQFGHLFHMPREGTHRLMGMWMLLVRTARTSKKQEVWFLVNGVPIRYSLKTMALISGFRCTHYPARHEQIGSPNFKARHFPDKTVVSLADVEAKLLLMERDEERWERVKMAYVYLLSSVLVGKRKTGAPVEPIFLRIVEDLQAVELFPWGRYAFDQNLKDIFHLLDHFKDGVGAQWVFPSFIMPLELLAFEAIPVLKEKYREEYAGRSNDCPRMCKTRFKGNNMKGFPLSEIYETLGTTTEIQSILEMTEDEAKLVAALTDEEDLSGDVDDDIVDDWIRRISKGKEIYFEEAFKTDVHHRDFAVEPAIDTTARPEAVAVPVSMLGINGVLMELRKTVEEGLTHLDDKLTHLDEKIDAHEVRVKKLEKKVKALKKRRRPRKEAKEDAEEAEEAEGDKEAEEADGEKERVEAEGLDALADVAVDAAGPSTTTSRGTKIVKKYGRKRHKAIRSPIMTRQSRRSDP